MYGRGGVVAMQPGFDTRIYSRFPVPVKQPEVPEVERSLRSVRACLKTPERGCVVPGQPQQASKFRGLGAFSPYCGWSATQPRSVLQKPGAVRGCALVNAAAGSAGARCGASAENPAGANPSGSVIRFHSESPAPLPGRRSTAASPARAPCRSAATGCATR